MLPALRRAAPDAEVVALFKPQFEVGRTEVGKGGIVRDPAVIEAALQRFRAWCLANGYEVRGEAPSELTGADGNQEIFLDFSPREPVHCARPAATSLKVCILHAPHADRQWSTRSQGFEGTQASSGGRPTATARRAPSPPTSKTRLSS